MKRLALMLMGCLLWSSVACASSEVDLFLVIGQSNAKGQGVEAPTITVDPWQAYEYNGVGFSSMQEPLGIPVSSKCGQDCYWTTKTGRHGPIVAFAKRWKELTGRKPAFVIRPKGGTGLLPDDAGRGYWSQYEYPAGTARESMLYLNAIEDFASAYSMANDVIFGVHKVYVIWIQGETDAINGVSKRSYKNELVALFNRLDGELYQRQRRHIDGFFISETGYFFGNNGKLGDADIRAHRDAVNNIVDAQDATQAVVLADGKAKVVVASNSARFYMSPCINGAAATGCGSNVDLIHYSTPTYEAIGTEMANFGATYSLNGTKPLLPQSCRAYPEQCAPSVNVYRWRSDVTADHATSLSPTAFDTKAEYKFKGIRYHLFKELAPGRVTLYSKYNSSTGDYMDTTNYAEGSPAYSTPQLLGYCYAQPQANAPHALVRLRSGDNRVTSVDPSEIAVWISNGFLNEGTLCYTL